MESLDIFKLDEDHNKNPTPRLVVRLKSSQFITDRGISFRTDIQVLKRKSFQYEGLLECLNEDISCDTIEFSNPVNSYEDGVYELKFTCVSTDYETGYCDSWIWKPIPYND